MIGSGTRDASFITSSNTKEIVMGLKSQTFTTLGRKEKVHWNFTSLSRDIRGKDSIGEEKEDAP